MAAPKKPTVAAIRAQIDAAEARVREIDARFVQAAFENIGDPSIDTGPALALLMDAREELASLQAALPLAEQAEAAALEETRARLAEEQRKRLEKSLRDLLKHALSLSVHYQNMKSAWLRMITSGEQVAGFLFEDQKRRGNGILPAQLSPGGLRRMADQEINRIGLLPSLQGGVSAPGTSREAIPINFANAPNLLPSLEAEIRHLAAAIMQSAPAPLPTGPASQVAAEPQPAPMGEAPRPIAEEEAA